MPNSCCLAHCCAGLQAHAFPLLRLHACSIMLPFGLDHITWRLLDLNACACRDELQEYDPFDEGVFCRSRWEVCRSSDQDCRSLQALYMVCCWLIPAGP